MKHCRPLYRVEQVRRLDQAAIATGVAGFELMSQAAQAAWDVVRHRWRWAGSLLVVAGGGNNGGDGLVLAALARRAGWPVRVLLADTPERYRGDAMRAWRQARDARVDCQAWVAQTLPRDTVVVDALLGSGLRGEVREKQAEIIRWINNHAGPVLALDVPSGLDADSGRPRGLAVRADVTVTFVGDKPGLHTGDGPDHAGEVVFAPLSVPESVRTQASPTAWLLPAAHLPLVLPPRPANGHKGLYGHVYCLGGGTGMPGAIRLCAEATLRAGAGLVSVGCAPEHVLAVQAGRPELMVSAVEAAQWTEQTRRASVLAVGPGLGRDGWADELLQAVLADERPLVLDADGLRGLGEAAFSGRAAVLTPHPGEAARLLGTTSTEVQADRLQAARTLAERLQAVVVLKGAGTVVAAPDGRLAIAPFALPAMGGPGFGDVLTGGIAALLAQGLEPWAAAVDGVLAHAQAAARVSRGRTRGVLASDLFAVLPEVLS